MEMLDVLDKNGEITNIKISKRQAHIEGSLHKAVIVFIFNEKGEILIQKRAACKKFLPNKWDVSVAGHVKSGEASIEACIRETKEELGIKIEKPEKFYVLKVNNKKYGVHNNEIIELYYLKTKIKLTELKLKKDEVSKVKFIKVKEFVNLLKEKNKKFVPWYDAYYNCIKELKKNGKI